MKFQSPSAALLALTALSFAAGAAQAQTQTQLQRVAVSGQGVGDLSLPPLAQVCPGYVQALNEQLSPVAERERSEAVVTVSFKLGGEQPAELRIQNGPLEYRKAVRRAMHQVSCQAGVAQGGAYKLLVSFNANAGDSDAPQAQQAAVSSETWVALAASR